MRLVALLRDPLTHFLAAGAALFLVASAVKPAETGDQTIIVDRASLLQHIQYRSKAFEPGAAEALLDGLSAEARDRLIADYVREEALDREARALGLDAGDYVIRQRRVQKAEFLAEAAALTAEPTDEDLNAYYEANKEHYRSPPAATLTHVFFSVKDRPREDAQALARAMLERLEADKAGFDDAPRYGERFLFHRNYVDRTDDYVESQLGAAAAEAVFDPATPLGRWTGPYSSDYGEHLLFVMARAPARLAPLDDIKDLVRADLVEERRQQAIDRNIDAVVGRYAVVNRLGDRP